MLRGIGEGVVIPQLDAETPAVVPLFAEAGQRQRQAVVLGMAGFKETAIPDDG